MYASTAAERRWTWSMATCCWSVAILSLVVAIWLSIDASWSCVWS
jgi:phosphate starvation-inducible membrane PsiE